MDSRTRRGCLWAAIGGAITLAMVGLAVVAGGGWLLYQSFGFASEPASPAAASEEFERLRQRFAGQQPLLQIGPDGVSRIVPRERPATADVQRVHTVVWDAKDRRLVRFEMPFWLLALSGEGNVRFGDEGAWSTRIELTADDLRRAGPGLVLDHARDDHRVLVWTE